MKSALLVNRPACPPDLKQHGYSVRFLNPRAFLSRVSGLERKSKGTEAFDEILVAFARDQLGLNLEDTSQIRKLLAGDLVTPPVAEAVWKKFPGVAYDIKINPKFLVQFTDSTPIKKAFEEFKRLPSKYSAYLVREEFAEKVLGIKKGPEVVTKLLEGLPISHPVAEAVLRKFRGLPFTLVSAKRNGPPPKLSLLDDMRENGVRYGFVPLGPGDRSLIKHINSTLRASGFKVAEPTPISQKDAALRLRDFHFIVNVCPENGRSHPMRSVAKLYDVYLTLSVSPRLLEAEAFFQRAHRKIAVIDGSPEHLLSRKLQLAGIVPISCDQPELQYQHLAELVGNGNFDAALINQYSLYGLNVMLGYANSSGVGRERVLKPAASAAYFGGIALERRIRALDLDRALNETWCFPLEIVTHWENAFMAGLLSQVRANFLSTYLGDFQTNFPALKYEQVSLAGVTSYALAQSHIE